MKAYGPGVTMAKGGGGWRGGVSVGVTLEKGAPEGGARTTTTTSSLRVEKYSSAAGTDKMYGKETCVVIGRMFKCGGEEKGTDEADEWRLRGAETKRGGRK